MKLKDMLDPEDYGACEMCGAITPWWQLEVTADHEHGFCSKECGIKFGYVLDKSEDYLIPKA